MTTSALPAGQLRDVYRLKSARIKEEFAAKGDGQQAVRARAALIDQVVLQLWNKIFLQTSDGAGRLALVAIGGYGRNTLFPYSDVDLLFLYSNTESEQAFKDSIRAFSQEMWDLGLKLSPASRSLSECERFDAANVEFSISLLDRRYVAGDRALFDELNGKVAPNLVMREAPGLVQRLVEITRNRHAKFGGTVFHLEPNVKDGPGGMRDFNVANWLALIAATDKTRGWAGDALLLRSIQHQVEAARDFLTAVRCFLHIRHGRDDNTLSWAAQDEAAARRIGVAAESGLVHPLSAEDWMRQYFSHARAVFRLCTQLLDEVPAAWSSLYRQFQSWRSRISDNDFSVGHGLIFLQQPASLQQPDMLLRLFHFMAQHGLKLSTATEQSIEHVLPAAISDPPRGGDLWLYLQEILQQPYAADALRAMHALKFLTAVLPELKAIDALVVRDYYHRFTVDEHSFLAIESLHRLRGSPSEWDKRYASVLEELEQPELLYLALLLHDVGKGLPGDRHIEGSLQSAESCLERLELDPAGRETVRFLIGSHLEMSAAMRRDIFDPETVQLFAEKVQSPERLKMLTLLTYADIKAVNPEALTPWKAENIWQLYIETSNYLNLSVDQRFHSGVDESDLVRALAPVAGRRLKQFLEGLPRRYLATCSAKDAMLHLEMAGRLKNSSVQLSLERGRHWFDLTLVTTDRPMLFAKVTGVLAAWGMSIVKANALSNAAGVVVDTFHFTDRFRTLELNLPEWERFKKSIIDVLDGTADLDRMLRDRWRSRMSGAGKTKVPTRIEFNDECSSRCTVLQVITQDKPGLLYRISSRLSLQQCNIEIALIDTEGEMAIDVFYLSSASAKLTPEHQKRVQQELLEELQGG